MECPPLPDACRKSGMALRLRWLADSFAQYAGKPLVAADGDDLPLALWRAPVAIVAHGVEPDPVFFFGNAVALRQFETDWTAFTTMPSRYSAEAPDRAERQRLLDRVGRHGFIDDYAGVRVTARGRRFRMENAIVWTIVDGQGQRRGQAAAFAPPEQAAV